MSIWFHDILQDLAQYFCALQRFFMKFSGYILCVHQAPADTFFVSFLFFFFSTERAPISVTECNIDENSHSPSRRKRETTIEPHWLSRREMSYWAFFSRYFFLHIFLSPIAFAFAFAFTFTGEALFQVNLQIKLEINLLAWNFGRISAKMIRMHDNPMEYCRWMRRIELTVSQMGKRLDRSSLNFLKSR